MRKLIGMQPSHAAGPRGHWLYGNLRAVREDPLRLFTEAQQQWGDVVHFRALGPLSWYLLSHPEHIDYVLRGNVDNFGKGYFKQRLELLVGQGVLTSEGATWQRQRRLLRPLFHRQRLAALAGSITTATAAMIERWEAQRIGEQPIDICALMIRLTMEIVGRALLGADISDEAGALGRSFNIAIEHLNYRTTHPMAVPERFPTPRNRRFARAMHTLDEIIASIIAARRQIGTSGDDMLGMLLDTRDEATGAGLSDQELRDEIVTMLVAGHDTPAITLTWAWYLLATHPEIERRLHAELTAVLAGRLPTWEDLPALRYTRMIVDETLRLYPPVWALGRQATRDDMIGGYHILAGALIVLSPYVTHRHPEFWHMPTLFDPERWSNSGIEQARTAYFPFGGGPRHCLGSHFGLLQVVLILATVAQQYRVVTLPEAPVEFAPLGTLRPRGGLKVRLQARSSVPNMMVPANESYR